MGTLDEILEEAGYKRTGDSWAMALRRTIEPGCALFRLFGRRPEEFAKEIHCDLLLL
jgi:hypothetical protein